MKIKNKITLTVLLWFLIISSLKSEPLIIDGTTGIYSVGKYIKIFEDKTGKVLISNIMNGEFDSSFIPSTLDTPNFGYSRSSFWIKLNITTNNLKNNEYYLEIPYSPHENIEFYLLRDHKIADKKLSGVYNLGVAPEPVYHNYAFPFALLEKDNIEILLRFHGENTMQFPIRIFTTNALIKKVNDEKLALGIFIGILIVMFFYNFFIYLSVKDTSYLFYLLYLIGMLFGEMSFKGIGNEYLWRSNIWISTHAMPFFIAFTLFGSSLFTQKFLNLKETAKKLYILNIIMSLLTSLACFVSLLTSYRIGILFSSIISFITVLVIIISGVNVFLKNYKPARFFLIAWFSLLFSMILFWLQSFGLFPSNFVTTNSIWIGSILEVVLLSFALGDKINVLKEEKEFAQKEVLGQQIRLTNSYARFVPNQIMTLLNRNSITQINLGDAIQKDMTILFSDIRSFTTMSEGMTPEENFGFINSYMALMGPCIRKYNGFIDKYIGDAIMALFPEKPSDAIDASIEMLEELHKLNLRRKEKGFNPISIGIGIHTGSQMLGIIGEKERLEGTVISDVVNTASRLEGLTKVYSSSIIISKDVMAKIKKPEKYIYRHLDSVKVKGKNKGVDILEILNGNSKRIIELKIKLKPLFEQGIEYYNKKDFDKAKENFYKVLKEDPKDKASELYIERCKFYMMNGVDHDWEGIEKLNFK